MVEQRMRRTITGGRRREVWTGNETMIAFGRKIQPLLFLIAFLMSLHASPAAFGQDDDVINDAIVLPPPRPVAVGQVMKVAQFNPEQVDQWIFSRWGGAQGAKSRLESNLELRIDDLERACELTDVQKKKLKLAGQGDIKRYYDRIEELKRKYGGGPSQPNLNNNIWQEMQPLQIELNNGLFGDDSIFVKTVKNTLTALQVRRHEDLTRRRVEERRRATIELFVVQIDKALGLSEPERGRLVELLVSETQPPKKYGQADYWYLMYQMTRLPESKIKSILDEPQWRLLSRQFTQARGMEPWLKSNGLLAQGDAAPVGAARAVEVRMQNFRFPAQDFAPTRVVIPKK
jgi:hypothetical protein